MELTGSCPLSLGIVRELTVSCHGVDWELSHVISSCHELTGSCHGVDWELSPVIRNCQVIDHELSWS